MNVPFLGMLSFLNPWMLAGLTLLPVLWYLLRVTPPAPKRIVFPAARFLSGLMPKEQTSSRTPWWILLMRLMAVALILIALARPVLNAGESLPGLGPVRIVVDNGWSAARQWSAMTQAASDIVDRAGRAHRPIYILTTTPEPGSDSVINLGPLTEGDAEAALRGLAPRPWPADYAAAGHALAEKPLSSLVNAFWISSGILDANPSDALMKSLETQGGLTVMHPDASNWPLLLRRVPGTDSAGVPEVYLDAPRGITDGIPVTLEARGPQGKVIDIRAVKLNASDLPQKITFDIPETLRGQIGRIVISGRAGAGGVLLFDDQGGRKSVGIVSAVKGAQSAPLIDASFYIERALSPYAELHNGTVTELLKLKPAAIVMPDIGAMPPEELNALEKWVKDGGLLMRFAGPSMAQAEAFLTPTPLRSGGRAMNGAMTWEKPPHVAAFPETSPYNGIDLPGDVTVKQQILAEPVDGLDKKTWAKLEDGTPLITADRLDKGLLVMVHTTATPAWSDLALSGAFVQILRRTINLAGSSVLPTQMAGGALQPLTVLDGFGNSTAPDSGMQPIASDKAATQAADSRHPPGLYGSAGVSRAFNLGDHMPPLRTISNLPMGAEDMTFGRTHERDLMPSLLTAALLFFLMDWLAVIILQAGWRIRFARGMTAALFVLAMLPAPSHAASADEDAVKYAGHFYLAYVRSGNAALDTSTQSGLEGLTQILRERTSVEPEGVVAVDPEQNDLSFFPLIYWPISESTPSLSANATRRVQSYLDHGGTILFDTADRSTAENSGSSNTSLQRVAGGLNIPPLIPMPEDHVLTRSFYLLQNEPGRYDNGILWVEDQSASGRDGVSSVIVGSNDWAYAWAAGNQNGGSQQTELALRFGVNTVMYALTGNYKADQVHLPEIMERLGR
jgi:hypothetical protein